MAFCLILITNVDVKKKVSRKKVRLKCQTRQVSECIFNLLLFLSEGSSEN